MHKPKLGACIALTAILCMGGSSQLFGESRIGVGELDSLISQHLPQQDPALTGRTLKNFIARQPVGGADTTTFLIPGFENYNCGQCHQPEQLVHKAAERMTRVLDRLKKTLPESNPVPLRQYIIQPYSDALLQPRSVGTRHVRHHPHFSRKYPDRFQSLRRGDPPARNPAPHTIIPGACQ